MFDDPRWGDDPRPREKPLNVDRDRSGGNNNDSLDRDDDWRQPETSRDRHDDARTLGRGPGDSRNSHSDESGHDPDDLRWGERTHDARERDNDVRDVFTRHLNLPRGPEREIVRDRDRQYTLRGSETRTLATVGAFRVVSSRDLRDHHERQAERLSERGARIDRVVLDHELKREYQSWLHERDRERPDYDGHPDRTDEEIRDWAHEHDLPYFDEEVHFPDLRIEYRDRDRREEHEDIEVTTEHYRGAHGASGARSGFSCYGGSSLRIGGGGSSRGSAGRHGGLAEEMLD